MRLLGYACIARLARGIAAANEGLVTGLSSKPVTMQTVYIQRDNANSDGLKGFFGGKNCVTRTRARQCLPKYPAKGSVEFSE